MPRGGKFRDDSFYGGPLNPTATMAEARADRRQPARSTPAADAPPPDDVWVPQLYEEHGLYVVSKITGLSLKRVREILVEQNVPIKAFQRPSKNQAS